MGSGNSKAGKNEALRLCKERRRFIKLAIDSRYALAAAHVSYVQSLRNIGIALRRSAESEMLIECSLITSATDFERTPSHSSYPLSPSHLGADVSYSPLENGSPISPVTTNLSYMRAANSAAVAVELNPANGTSLEDDSLPMPPPPVPPFASGSWDFFDPIDDCEGFRFVGNNAVGVDFEDLRGIDHGGGTRQTNAKEVGQLGAEHNVNGPAETLESQCALEQSSSTRGNAIGEKDLSAEREDPSEFVTHRAKDFLSSIKYIEHRFFRASEAGRQVSRMVDSNKIKPMQHVSKIIHWKRSTSLGSSSSRNPLATGDADDSASDFIEEFCMIAGSHLSTLERLYAWERKLHDEVKSSESIRKEYDQKCDQLRHQFAKGLSTRVIDKTRAVVKDLHSRIRVALHSVNNISKRIEKMRDEELQPQLVELTEGLLRMWKAMLECHHSQYIIISLAYHSRNSTDAAQVDARRQIMAQLRQEFEWFGVSFIDWVNSHASYLEALNGWLQNCIIEPQERSKNRYPFSPHRYLGYGPPIFVLCREWSAGLKALPAEELSVAIKAFMSDIFHLMDQVDKLQKEHKLVDANNGESESKDGLHAITDGDTTDDASSTLSCIQASLTRVLDRLNKFCEASVKMYEDVRQKSDAARIAYLKLQAN
ncbi:nitrate regulatory gene2 protein-like [Hibiscus syriacus]|uniref:nitrate regulatory gene2 protein-like n=1 Tax=Hibiscus syriacus TaxID=106335 RepID=UPI001924FF20|nr:nitrate regulatory gene2 protein-like [Hibiscus syriacus]